MNWMPLAAGVLLALLTIWVSTCVADRRLRRAERVGRALREAAICAKIRELRREADALIKREPGPELDEDELRRFRQELERERDAVWLRLLSLALSPDAARVLEEEFL